MKNVAYCWKLKNIINAISLHTCMEKRVNKLCTLPVVKLEIKILWAGAIFCDVRFPTEPIPEYVLPRADQNWPLLFNGFTKLDMTANFFFHNVGL